MANKKTGVVNNGNVDFFITYIANGNRVKKMPTAIVEELTELAREASHTAITLRIDSYTDFKQSLLILLHDISNHRRHINDLHFPHICN